jgi:hypothetical protein
LLGRHTAPERVFQEEDVGLRPRFTCNAHGAP